MNGFPLTLVYWLIGGYVVLILVLYGAQRRLIYHPDQTAPAPAAHGVPEMQAVGVPTPDGLTLHSWWRPPTSAHAPVMIYFHGNAGNLDARADKVRPYLDAGYGVLLAGYRYNSGAGGSPSEDALIADGKATMRFVAEQSYPPDRIVLYGESLGSGVAAGVAAQKPVAALALEAPFTSVADVAQDIYWYMPARWLVRDRFDSAARLRNLNVPVLIVHGAEDRVVRPKFARRLYEAANEPKALHMIEGAHHLDLHDHGMARIVMEFLDGHLAREPPSTP